MSDFPTETQIREALIIKAEYYLNPSQQRVTKMYEKQKEEVCDRIYTALMAAGKPLTVYGICEDAGCYWQIAKFALIDLMAEGFVMPDAPIGNDLTFKAVRPDDMVITFGSPL